MGFDDAPFEHTRNSAVNVSGIVCANTRFEGMVWGQVAKDGTDATSILANMLTSSKFYDQINVVLTDGIGVGGFNLIDLPALSELTQRPVIALMRKQPDLIAIDRALKHFDDYEYRVSLIKKAGQIYSSGPFIFQVAGCNPDTAEQVLSRLTDTGHVPEALRLAHLIGSAIKTGQSSSRA